LGNPVCVAWRTTLSRQAVHSRNPEKDLWEHEPPGGSSMPTGSFWKFPEIHQNPSQTQIIHYINRYGTKTHNYHQTYK